MNKSVVWVHRLGNVMASYRYRAEIPCNEVAKINGFTTALNDGEADIVVFSKPYEGDLGIARKAKADGAKIVVDLCDDNFGTQEREIYTEFADLADAITTATTVMRGRLFDYVKKDAVVIPDPYEFDEVEPHADGDDYLWFGHMRNFPELVSVMKSMGKRKLRVVTGPQPAPNSIPWSPYTLRQVFAVSNRVILPTMLGHEYKSPNRLVNAIRQGCFPICMDHPSYMPFKHMVWVGQFIPGLQWAEHFHQDLNGLVKEAQNYVRDRYSPETIGKQWADFLESV